MKIRHGLSDCYYCTENGTPKKLPGAVRLELSGSVDTSIVGTFNIPARLKSAKNIGYTGKLELSLLPEEFCVDIFGWTLSNGVLTEVFTDSPPVPFQLLWQVKGTGERFVLFCCFALKPDISDQTDGKSAQTATAAIKLYAYYDENGRIKSNTTAGTSKSVYDGWFETRH